jgi:hypothetical protein
MQTMSRWGNWAFAFLVQPLFLFDIAFGQWKQMESEEAKLSSLATMDSIVLAGSFNAVLLSTNSGLNLEKAPGQLNNKRGGEVAIVRRADGGLRLISGEYINFVYYSDDTGRSWQWLNELDGIFSSVAPVPLPGGRQKVFVFTRQGLYASNDLGTNWQPSNGGMDMRWLPHSFSSANGLVFAVGAYEDSLGGIYKSTDEGASWTKIKQMASRSRRILSMKVSAKPDYLFAASRTQGVLRSSDLGETWEQRNNGLPGLDVFELGAKGNLLIAIVGYLGLHVSTDYGETWSFAGQGITDSVGYTIALNDNFAYFGGVTSGLWRRPLTEFYTQSVTRATTGYIPLVIYPNPTNGNITIDYESKLSGAETLSVYSVDGVLVHEEIVALASAGKPIKLDASGWASGAYTIVLKSGENEARGSVIKN